MDLREIGLEGVDWNHLGQDRDQWWALVNTVMNLRVPYKAGYFFEYLSFSRTTLIHGARHIYIDVNTCLFG
jgi:hypothetical protein